MVPADRPKLLPALTCHMIGEVEKIARALPNDRIAVQWDVCQEVLAWEGYYEPSPADFHSETIAVLTEIGDAVPAAVELGYHLCYGSPADEHLVQPKDAGIMVEIVNRIVAGVRRPIQFFHLPVPHRARTTRSSCRWKNCGCPRGLSCILGWCTTTTTPATTPVWRRRGGMRESTGSPLNAAWRAAIRRNSRTSFKRMPSSPGATTETHNSLRQPNRGGGWGAPAVCVKLARDFTGE